MKTRKENIPKGLYDKRDSSTDGKFVKVQADNSHRKNKKGDIDSITYLEQVECFQMTVYQNRRDTNKYLVPREDVMWLRK